MGEAERPSLSKSEEVVSKRNLLFLPCFLSVSSTVFRVLRSVLNTGNEGEDKAGVLPALRVDSEWCPVIHLETRNNVTGLNVSVCPLCLCRKFYSPTRKRSCRIVVYGCLFDKVVSPETSLDRLQTTSI